MRKVATILLAVFLVAGLASVACATMLVQLDSITPITSGIFSGDYRWSYSATISATDGLKVDGTSYFTIYDLLDTLVTVESPVDWGASSQLLGDTPSGLTPTDDPTLENVTFFPSISGGERPGTGVPISNFDVILTMGSAVLSEFSWTDWDGYPPSPSYGASPQSGLGTVSVTPEPASLLLLGIGLLGLAVSRRRTQ